MPGGVAEGEVHTGTLLYQRDYADPNFELDISGSDPLRMAVDAMCTRSGQPKRTEESAR